MLKFGLVQEVAPGRAQVRIRFPGDDDLVSDWLPILQHRAFKDRVLWMPAVGEQVACLMDEGAEDGVVLGSIFSQADPVPPSTSPDAAVVHFADGTRLEYSPQKTRLAVTLVDGTRLEHVPGVLKIDINGNVDAKAKRLAIDVAGDAEIKGKVVNVTAATAINLAAPLIVFLSALGKMTLGGGGARFDLQGDIDLIANNIRLQSRGMLDLQGATIRASEHPEYWEFGR